MATSRNGSILGRLKGKIGPAYLSDWKALHRLSSMPKDLTKSAKKKKASAGQVVLFKNVQYLLKNIHSLIKLTFPEPPRAKMTSFNLAVSVIMDNAKANADGIKSIDYSQLKLSKWKDTTQQLWNPSVRALTERKFQLTWEHNPFPLRETRLDDLVFVMFCSKEDPRLKLIQGTLLRSALSREFIVKSKLVSHEIFVYVVIVSADHKRVARTDYLGNFTVLA
jgi:hypothetical protein